MLLSGHAAVDTRPRSTPTGTDVILNPGSSRMTDLACQDVWRRNALQEIARLTAYGVRCDSAFAPSELRPFRATFYHPGLARWATFLRRFAARLKGCKLSSGFPHCTTSVNWAKMFLDSSLCLQDLHPRQGNRSRHQPPSCGCSRSCIAR